MRSDEALLLDMLKAAQKIQRFTKRVSEEDFNESELIQSAVLREFQVIGEAARMVTAESKAKYTNVPWRVIAGMRNRLIHEYFAIRLTVVWETIQNDIPSLIAELEKLIPPGDEAQGDK